jgi:membrane-associated phospholipid phosphatase
MKSCTKFSFSFFGFTAACLVVLSLIVPKGSDVVWINSRNTPFLDGAMAFVTDLGAGWLFLFLLLIALFLKFRYAAFVASAWAGHGIVCAILKRGVFGPVKRPVATLDNTLLHFVPDVNVHSFFSFPSGHTATIFCFALVSALLIKNRWATFALCLLALLVGYSRIYLLQHFLVDVAWGAMIGVFCTAGFWIYFEKAKLPAWMNSYLRINRDFSLKLTN